ncbi:type II toxin-antitoxin system Phd/YefM family antitoxin [Acidithiobacillus sulfurivorans]|uniref:type II toxin-antitoxin system Phd/YefM family antitoxin n=1 Tax=Acidithiobacillus sulfurivorans TaxID=1958756 RepID=UPI001D029722|nr:type II toxin-antitoxin system Phd/YefM family antitoxin [Acidithiobacillus sulfurivorans]
MPVINMHEAKTQLSRYVDQAASGEEKLSLPGRVNRSRVWFLCKSQKICVFWGRVKSVLPCRKIWTTPLQAEIEAMFYEHES